MANVLDALSELIALRSCHELLEQDLSQAIHLLYTWIVWVAKLPPSEFRHRTLNMLHAKFLQMPQGFPLGRALIDLDAKFGEPLESLGVRLEQWVYEPREHRNGQAE